MIANLALAIACVALIITLHREFSWSQVKKAVDRTDKSAERMQEIAAATAADLKKLIELREESAEFDRKAVARLERRNET